jgi:hypothetical protein
MCSIPVLFAATFLVQPQDKPNAEDAKLTALFKQYLDDDFKQRPLEATRLGDHRFDHLLDDVSAKTRAGWT